MRILRTLIQIVAGLLLVVVLVFPPFKFVWTGATTSHDGFLGYYLLWNPPTNPIEVMRAARIALKADNIELPSFNHATDRIRVEIDALRLLIQIGAVILVAGVATAVIDKGINKIAN